MPLNAIDSLGLLLGITWLSGGIIIIIGWPVMRIFFPKELEEKVMKPPYFPEHHAMMLGHFPQNFMRTNYIVGSICFDFYGRRLNGLQDARTHAPAWYRRSAYFVMYAGLLNGSISMILLILYFQLT